LDRVLAHVSVSLGNIKDWEQFCEVIERLGKAGFGNVSTNKSDRQKKRKTYLSTIAANICSRLTVSGHGVPVPDECEEYLLRAEQTETHQLMICSAFAKSSCSEKLIQLPSTDWILEYLRHLQQVTLSKNLSIK
jgi:hypothetical protein